MKLNSCLTKCHEMMQSNDTSDNSDNEDSMDIDEMLFSQEKPSFVEKVQKVMKEVQSAHDFKNEVQIKKEMKKQKIIREI